MDALLKVRSPSPADRERIERATAEAPAVDSLLENAAELLHSLSHHAGVVTTPAGSREPSRAGTAVRPGTSVAGAMACMAAVTMPGWER